MRKKTKDTATKAEARNIIRSVADREFMDMAERAAYEISCMLIPPECRSYAVLAEFAAMFKYEMADR